MGNKVANSDSLLTRPLAGSSDKEGTIETARGTQMGSGQADAVASQSPTASLQDPNRVLSKILIYPAFDSEDSLIDTMSRVAWYLSFSPISKFIVFVAQERLAKTPWRVAPGMDPAIDQRLVQLRRQVEFVVGADDEAFRLEAETSAAILCWNSASSQWLFDEKAKREKWVSKIDIWNVDPNTHRNEGAQYTEASYRLTSDLPGLKARNQEKFDALARDLGKFDSAFVLATGPSAKHYHDLNRDDALGIVCNSIILDDELMRTLQPQFLVFADPIFHFGPSQYAASFREALRRAAKKYKFTIFIPIKYNDIFLSCLPELADRMIAIPYNQRVAFKSDLKADFEVKVTANVLTFLMMPLAYTFSDRVYILGCDGRPISEDKYFWKHNPKTQINDKMENIKSVHPAFFAIDYNDYYNKHCELLEQQISEAEAAGKQVVCMAHSYIPALEARMFADFKPATAISGPYLPRVLVIDPTAIGAINATGQIKKRLMGQWHPDSVMQIVTSKGAPASVFPLKDVNDVQSISDEAELLSRIRAFQPEVIYYRPLEQHPALGDAAKLLLNELNLPIVSHIMDDWPAVVASGDPIRGEAVDRELNELFARSHSVLSISEKMSESFTQRYRILFEAIANGVDPASCRRAAEGVRSARLDRGDILMRYTGALADNMTSATILSIARAVDKLQDTLPLRFEIYTMPAWREKFKAEVAALRGVTVLKSVPDDQYGRLLAEADILVLGYNFDPESVAYIRYSLPNKLPEYLGSGAAVLAVGPADTAAMELLSSNDLGVRVTTQDEVELTAAITDLATDTSKRRHLAERAQAWAFEHRDINAISARFATILTDAALSGKLEVRGYPREDHFGVDETEVVADLSADRRGRCRIMLDVGAHYGSSAAYFDRLDWTIHCFEPDPANRARLEKRFGSHENVTIDPRAVSDVPAQGVSFFQSEESTGISGLHAFRDTHRESGKVDVTTVAEIVADRNISAVDFLKIDVEGFDFSVLKGVPWDRLQPDVVECEFEDYKTVPLGHTYRDVAQYLVDKGYTVYLSEWHPIIRYGQGHDWRRVVPFPGVDLPDDAWGNILAFRADPGLAAIADAFSRLKKARKPPVAAQAADAGKKQEPLPTVVAAAPATLPQDEAPSSPPVLTPQTTAGAAASTVESRSKVSSPPPPRVEETASEAMRVSREAPASEPIAPAILPHKSAAPPPIAKKAKSPERKTHGSAGERAVPGRPVPAPGNVAGRKRTEGHLTLRVRHFTLWAARTASRYPAPAVALALLLVAAVAGIVLADDPVLRLALAFGALGLVGATVTLALLGFVNHLRKRLRDEYRVEVADWKASRRQARPKPDRSVASEVPSRDKERELSQRLAKIKKETARLAEIDAALSKELKAVRKHLATLDAKDEKRQ